MTDIEDERGNLWEVPDDEGRIRVRDLDGDLITWYDPGDDGYDDAIARFQGAASMAINATETTSPTPGLRRHATDPGQPDVAVGQEAYGTSDDQGEAQ